MNKPLCPECNAPGEYTGDENRWKCSDVPGYEFLADTDISKNKLRITLAGDIEEAFIITTLEGQEHE